MSPVEQAHRERRAMEEFESSAVFDRERGRGEDGAEEREAQREIHAEVIGAPSGEIAGFRAEPASERDQREQPDEIGSEDQAEDRVDDA
jgi:hypothetical protein